MRDPFPLRKYPGRILLRCEGSSMAGSWKALAAILPKPHGTEIWGCPDLDEGEPEKIALIDGAFSERACVAFLANDATLACGGDFIGDAEVLGTKGVWADLLLLAWMHDEEVGLNRVAVELLSLDDDKLKEFWSSSGPFDGYFAERVANALLQLRDDAGIDEAVPLADLLARACPGVADLDAFEAAIPRLIEEEEEREEARQEARRVKLLPFESAISRALARMPAHVVGSDAAGSRIRAFLEEQALTTGRLPTGVHDFGHIRTGYRSGLDVGKVDLDALFAEP